MTSSCAYNDRKVSPFEYLNKLNAEQRAYAISLSKWAFRTFMNTSCAPRNDAPWFTARCQKTLDDHKKRTGKPLIVGLTGLAGSGKDSAIDFLCNHSGFMSSIWCKRIALADPLKEIAKVVGFTDKQLTDRTLKETTDQYLGISPREFLQMCGTEMFRKVWREDIWIKMMLKRVADICDTGETSQESTAVQRMKTFTPAAIFITDVRFPNEAESIKSIGGIICRIKRTDNPNAIASTHDSERFISEINADLEISNRGNELCETANEWSWTFTSQLMRYLNNSTFYA